MKKNNSEEMTTNFSKEELEKWKNNHTQEQEKCREGQLPMGSADLTPENHSRVEKSGISRGSSRDRGSNPPPANREQEQINSTQTARDRSAPANTPEDVPDEVPDKDSGSITLKDKRKRLEEDVRKSKSWNTETHLIFSTIREQDRDFIKKLEATILFTPSPMERGKFIEWLLIELKKLTGDLE